MIAVETNDHEIRVNISTDGMSAEAVRAFLDWLRVEAAARRSRLTDDAAWKLSKTSSPVGGCKTKVVLPVSGNESAHCR